MTSDWCRDPTRCPGTGGQEERCLQDAVSSQILGVRAEASQQVGVGRAWLYSCPATVSHGALPQQCTDSPTGESRARRDSRWHPAGCLGHGGWSRAWPSHLEQLVEPASAVGGQMLCNGSAGTNPFNSQSGLLKKVVGELSTGARQGSPLAPSYLPVTCLPQDWPRTRGHPCGPCSSAS